MSLFSNNKFNRNRAAKRLTSRPRPSYYRASVSKVASSSPFRKKTSGKSPGRSLLTSFRNFLVVFLLVVGLIYCLGVKAQPKVAVNDTSYHSVQDYQAATTANLKALRNRNKITLDGQGITNSLKRRFPEIDSVKIKLPIFSQVPTFDLQIAAPTFNLSSGGSTYIVGSNGVVAALSGSLPNSSKLPMLIDQSGFEAAPGKQVLGTEAIGFINSVLAQCQQAKLLVQSLTLPARAQELDLQAAGSPYFVKFTFSGDALTQVGQYLAAKHKFDSEGGQPSQYLDVRVAGKIFYK